MIKIALTIFSSLLISIAGMAQSMANNHTYSIGTEAIEYYPQHGKRYADENTFTGYAKDILDAFFSAPTIKL